ncbi:unnamed protein product [Didymodactylos carnosus]|uniref:Uncharacterized protein n=1 Tax=Didymodactylos carnosus TaxID=1234261 RepID=A0A8S2CZA5_9BILA|nr:unnamed protein product [Didymodactylos carnosus]CAF3558844.1 unnamed protein product [Didymodactylos carnosus]
MIIRCFEYMENMKMIIKDEEIVHGKIERLLKGLETAFQYQYDISDLVAILMKVDLLADSINKHPSFTSNFLSKSPPDSIHAVQQLKEMLTFRPYMQRSAANEIWDYSAYRERGLFEMPMYFKVYHTPSLLINLINIMTGTKWVSVGPNNMVPIIVFAKLINNEGL